MIHRLRCMITRVTATACLIATFADLPAWLLVWLTTCDTCRRWIPTTGPGYNYDWFVAWRLWFLLLVCYRASFVLVLPPGCTIRVITLPARDG